MRISELKTYLEGIEKEHGDLDIEVSVDGFLFEHRVVLEVNVVNKSNKIKVL